jgi:predicted nucleic acid-binding protein
LKIVCNTSPLILLAKIHRLDTLIRLYSELMIPKAVADEIGTKPGKENDQVQALLKKGALQLRQVSAKILAELPIDLGRGEREAIALAIDSGADLVILDDRQGRLVSRDRGLTATGTVGVLIEAKERGFIPSLRPEMDRLIEAGMWINEVFYHRILKEYRE